MGWVRRNVGAVEDAKGGFKALPPLIKTPFLKFSLVVWQPMHPVAINRYSPFLISGLRLLIVEGMQKKIRQKLSQILKVEPWWCL